MIVSCDSRTNNTCKTSSLAENGISELFFKSLTYPEYIVGQNLTKKVQFRKEALCTGCLKAPHGILGEKKFFPSHYSLVQSAQYCATFSTAGSNFFAHFLAKY